MTMNDCNCLSCSSGHVQVSARKQVLQQKHANTLNLTAMEEHKLYSLWLLRMCTSPAFLKSTTQQCHICQPWKLLVNKLTGCRANRSGSGHHLSLFVSHTDWWKKQGLLQNQAEGLTDVWLENTPAPMCWSETSNWDWRASFHRKN